MANRRIGGLTLAEWIRAFVEREYPGEDDLSRPDVGQRAFSYMPQAYLPTLQELAWAWFRPIFNRTVKREGWALPGGRAGDRMVRQLAMEWPEFEAFQVGRLVLARADVESVRADTIVWAEAKNPTMDVDAAIARLLQAAGF